MQAGGRNHLDWLCGDSRLIGDSRRGVAGNTDTERCNLATRLWFAVTLPGAAVDREQLAQGVHYRSRPGSTSATNLEFRVGRGVFRPPDDSAGTRWCCDRTGRNLSRVTSQSRLKQLESVRQDVYIKPLSGFPYLTIKMGRHCFGSHDR